MSPTLWREFILPVLRRMYGFCHEHGKYVMIHSCGDVDELFDDLIAAGANCFNPFQPEVMDVFALLERYRGRLAFLGGLSTQRTLPFGTPDDVRRETQRLLAAGQAGGYIFAPRLGRRRRAAGEYAGVHRNRPEPRLEARLFRKSRASQASSLRSPIPPDTADDSDRVSRRVP